MEGDQQQGGYGMMHQGDDISIPIPIPVLVPVSDSSRGSDSGLHGANSESGPYSASNGTRTTIRRRHTEPGSVKNSAMKRPAYYPIRSRVLQVEESHPASSNATPESKNSLYKKIKSMKSGILQSERKKGEGYDSSSSDEKDDSDDIEDDKQETEEKATGEVQKGGDCEEKRRKCRKIGKKLKAYDVIIEWILFTFTMVLLIASLYADDLKTRAVWGLEIWKWCVLVAVIFCGRLVTKWAKDCIVFLIETKFLFNEKVVYFVHGVKQSVRFAIWLALVLVAWVLLIDKKHTKHSVETAKALSYITKALVSSLIGAVMWMVKTLLVKFIAATFHVKTFFVKIREAVSDEYVLWTLSVPRSMDQNVDGVQAKGSRRLSWLTQRLPKWMRGREKKSSIEEKCQQEEKITLKDLGRMKPGKMPASTMGQLINRIKSSKLSIVSSALYEDPVDDGGEQTKITSRSEAERAASLIFKNVKKAHPEYITKEDLLVFENNENKDCLNEWFLKVAEEDKITEPSLSEWVVSIYKQREYLSHSLKDAKTAIEELNRILSGLVVILILIVWLLLMGFATTKVLLFCSSQILLVGFMFGNTCRTLFEAMVFVFVMHPFDVGDRCVIDGVQMIVEEMDILKTAFLRYDSEMIYYPNAVLATKAISNFNRSPEKMGESVCFDIDVSTSVASIQSLKDAIKKYVEDNTHHWHPDQTLQIKEIENMNKMKMVLFINHRMNFQDYIQKMNRRTELMLALKQMFEHIGIKYHLLPQEVHINQIGSAFPESASTAYPRAM